MPAVSSFFKKLNTEQEKFNRKYDPTPDFEKIVSTFFKKLNT
jgi:hypothetical protein